MAKILNSPITTGKIRLKKFVPGICVEDKCPSPKCGEKAALEVAFLYPSWGRNSVELICPICRHCWSVDIEISIIAKIVKGTK